MKYIFISYAKKDIDLANSVRLALKSEGYSVWWDENITSGNPWEKEIHEALKTSEVIVVLWTENSKDSDWVKHEASVATLSSKLLQVRVGDISVIPSIFQTIQAPNLTNWNSREDHPGFIKLLFSIKEKNKQINIRKFLKYLSILAAFSLVLYIGSVIQFENTKDINNLNKNINIQTTANNHSQVGNIISDYSSTAILKFNKTDFILSECKDVSMESAKSIDIKIGQSMIGTISYLMGGKSKDGSSLMVSCIFKEDLDKNKPIYIIYLLVNNKDKNKRQKLTRLFFNEFTKKMRKLYGNDFSHHISGPSTF